MGQILNTNPETFSEGKINNESITNDFKQKNTSYKPVVLADNIEILINAYIFQIEQELRANTIIPETIITLCSKYYDNDDLIYLIDTNSSYSYVYGSQNSKLFAMNMGGDKIWKTTLYSLFPNQLNYNLGHYLLSPQYIAKRNVRLPTEIAIQATTKYRDLSNGDYKLNDKYDMIFISETRTSYAIIIDSAQNYRSNDSLVGLNWELPSKSATYECTAATFSHKYGLIEFRDNTLKTTGYHLNFNEYDENNWKWKQIKDTINPHHISTCCMLDDDKLIVLGGKFSMEIYDFDEKEWMELMKPNLFPSTTYYDKGSGHLFVSNCIDKVDYYDFIKNEWIKLPDTNTKYYENTAMWTQYNLLYIATSLSQSVEFIDLRMNNNGNHKKWQICESSIEPPFGTGSTLKYIVYQ